MGIAQLLEVIGTNGLPAVAAAVVLWLFVRSQARQEKRYDRLEDKLLNGDGLGGVRSALDEVRALLLSRPCMAGEQCSHTRRRKPKPATDPDSETEAAA